MDETDLRHLRRCVELAEQALDSGDEPFGSVLVTGDGTVLAEDHRVARHAAAPASDRSSTRSSNRWSPR